jgi:hypothetical protein
MSAARPQPVLPTARAAPPRAAAAETAHAARRAHPAAVCGAGDVLRRGGRGQPVRRARAPRRGRAGHEQVRERAVVRGTRASAGGRLGGRVMPTTTGPTRNILQHMVSRTQTQTHTHTRTHTHTHPARLQHRHRRGRRGRRQQTAPLGGAPARRRVGQPRRRRRSAVRPTRARAGVPWSTQEYPGVPKSTLEYPGVPWSTQVSTQECPTGLGALPSGRPRSFRWLVAERIRSRAAQPDDGAVLAVVERYWEAIETLVSRCGAALRPFAARARAGVAACNGVADRFGCCSGPCGLAAASSHGCVTLLAVHGGGEMCCPALRSGG